MLQKITNYLTETVLDWSAPDTMQKRPWLFWLWGAALFLGGFVLWCDFFQWGNAPLNFHDWKDITMPRLVFMSNAFHQGVLPLHIADGYPLGGVTDRFLTIPDIFFSPQFLLLRWMEIRPFLLLNFLLMYAVGFGGLMWIA